MIDFLRKFFEDDGAASDVATTAALEGMLDPVSMTEYQALLDQYGMAMHEIARLQAQVRVLYARLGVSERRH